MKKNVFILFFIFLLIPVIYSNDVLIEYIDGLLELRTDKSWSGLEIGDEVFTTDTLRLGEDSVAELSYDDRIYIIHEPGPYKLSELFSLGRKEWGIGSLLEGKFDSLINGPDTESLAASMGARATSPPEEPGIEWMEDESAVFDEGIELLGYKKYKEAVRFFESIEKSVEPGDREEYYYYLGYSYVMCGEKARALKLLFQIKDNKNTGFYSDLILIKSNLLVEAFSFDKAIVLLNYYIDADIIDKNRPAIFFLAGACLMEMEKYLPAFRHFQEVKRLEPRSPLGKSAAGYMEILKKEL